MSPLIKCLLAIACFNLVACGNTPPATNDSLASLETDTSLEQFEQNLQGTWNRPCQYGGSSIGYYKESMAFSGVDAAFTLMTKDFYYSDSGCTALTMIRSQTFDVQDINPNGSGWSYTATSTGQSYAAQTPAAAASLNSAQACGITQWVAGLNVDTSKTGCNLLGAGSVLDTLYLDKESLTRSLDEVANPNVISGTLAEGTAYLRQQ